jgi:hypothetical protein
MLNTKNIDLIEEASTDKEIIIRRNERLKLFFDKIFDQRYLIIGDPNKPSVIYLPKEGPSRCVSCFVHNFTLVFTSEPFNGEHLYSVTLNNKNIKYPEKSKVIEVINSAQHKTVFRIKVKNTPLYLSGYNFTDKADYETKYPVFAPFGEKIYFNINHAIDIIDRYPELNLEATAY